MQPVKLGETLEIPIDHTAAGSIQSLDLDSSLSEDEQFREFRKAAEKGNLVPIYERLFSDQLTPVNAYRCLVEENDHSLPSFLYESVVNGDQTVSTTHSFTSVLANTDFRSIKSYSVQQRKTRSTQCTCSCLQAISFR